MFAKSILHNGTTATWRLLRSSFLAMTCFLIRDSYILPKKELHRSLPVDPGVVDSHTSALQRGATKLRGAAEDTQAGSDLKPKIARQSRDSRDLPFLGCCKEV